MALRSAIQGMTFCFSKRIKVFQKIMGRRALIIDAEIQRLPD